MLIVDSRLDLALNALQGNRDLLSSAYTVRVLERSMRGPGRAQGTVGFPEMRRGRIALCITTVLARSTGRPEPHIDYPTPAQAHGIAMGHLAYYHALERQGHLRIVRDAAQLNAHIAGDRTIAATKVRPIRPYDLRHTCASLLIAAGKNPLYIARPLGHYSAGFTLDTYGHLMESVPRVQVEWIDEFVFPEGFEAALNLHLSGALSGAESCNPVQFSKGLEPRNDAGSGSVVQSGATECIVPRAGFEPALSA